MKKVLGLIALLVIAGFFFLGDDKKEEVEFTEIEKEVETKTIEKHDHSHDHGKAKLKVKSPIVKKPNQEKAIVPPFKPKDENEESLAKLSTTFAEVFEEKKDSKSLRESLRNLNLRPTVNINSNPYTGSMNIVRTKDTLPGTRYVHAQYMADENGNETLQHLSFEYRPGPQAFQRATEAIKSEFKIKGDPIHSKGDFVSFKLDEHYIIWLKRMGENDLKDDPFNAYTKNDAGTIRVAIELEIHGDETDTHVYPDGN
ncbi:MAG: hypothetical protein CME70_19805 [Halobacteriovorax sp.]|nr:hypothetical protein [Halobacteriovorax sp.]|tara:strand:- start:22935 stop:23702 length:768 start_codon:yes stop_codon:yes gene_type:complete